MPVSRDVVSDKAWAVIGPLFPAPKATGRPCGPAHGCRGHGVAVSDRGAVAGPARAVRELEHDLQELRPVVEDRGVPVTRIVAATIAHRRKRPGRPIDFGDEQRERYRGRNVVERCFNRLKQWRGLAMRSDKTARNHHSGQCLAATLHWVQTFSNTA